MFPNSIGKKRSCVPHLPCLIPTSLASIPNRRPLPHPPPVLRPAPDPTPRRRCPAQPPPGSLRAAAPTTRASPPGSLSDAATTTCVPPPRPHALHRPGSMRAADSDHLRGAAPTTCTPPPVSLCTVGVEHLSAGAMPRSKLEVHYMSAYDLPCSSPRVLLFLCRQKPAMLQRTVLRGIPGSSPKTVVKQSSRGRSNKDARGVFLLVAIPLLCPLGL